LEITGPTLQDLKWRAHTNYENVARAVSGRSAGFFLGAILGGLIVDKFFRFCDLIIGVFLVIAALATIAAPWASSIELLWFLILVQGVAESVLDIGTSSYYLFMSS
jgi:MFS family permease